jgi:hypothetical protein
MADQSVTVQDALTHDEHVRLEALNQAVALSQALPHRASLDTLAKNALATADLFVAYIEEGTRP